MPGRSPITEKGPHFFIVTNKSLRILMGNEKLLQTISDQPRKVIGRHIKCLHDILPFEKCQIAIKKCIKKSVPIPLYLNKSSAIRKTSFIYWEVSASRNEEKEVIGFYFIGQIANPTKKQNKSEKQFKTLSENVPGAVYEYAFNKDGSCGFAYLSPAIEKMFGIKRKEFMQSYAHVHPDDLDKLISANKFSQETNKPFQFEGRLITTEGQIKWHSATSSFSYVTENASRIFTGIIQDITDKKVAEEEIRHRESRIRLILEKIGDNFWEHNFLKNETLFSRTIFDFIGYAAKDLQANIKLWWDNIYAEDKWMVEEIEEKYRKGEIENHSLEYRIFHADGTLKWVLDRGVVIEKSADGKPIKAVGTHTDITMQKDLQLEKETLERYQKKQTLQTILEAHERERQEIADELHENIGQSLSSCKLILDYSIKKRKFSKNDLEKVTTEINSIIDEIRNISYNLSTTTLKLIGLPQALSELMIRFQKEKRIPIALNYKNFSLPDNSNFKALLTIYRAAQEGLANVLKHSQAKRVSMKLWTSKNEVCIEVVDDGKGFDTIRFKKGLGLTSIFSRVENLNGNIEFISQANRGCRLFASIPI